MHNEREPLLVLEPLLALPRARTGSRRPEELTAEPIGDGHSNVTFALSTGVVLRRPPRGPLPPSAHDVLREARLLRALEPTDVRTPKILAVCDDESVIGAPFYVMELVDGEVITDSVPAALDHDGQRRRIADELVDGLVELHDADWQRLGLEGFGKPTGYLERQLRRFHGLWEHNRTRDLAEVAQVGSWLAEHLPQSPPATIVHGDYRLGNTIYGRVAPARLVAILDWEMATIGDPLADVGYLMTHWVQPDDPAGFVHAASGHPGTRVPDPGGAGRPLRGTFRPVGRTARLVRDAGAMEGGRVHGGQLQAGDRRHDRRPVPEDVRRRRRAAGAARTRDHPHRVCLVDDRGAAADHVAMSRARASAAAALACSALLLAGCGSSSLSGTQLRRKAGRICETAQRASEAIAAPTDPSEGQRFLRHGIAALAPQVTALHGLNPPSDLQDDYTTALRATDHELALLRSALRGLQGGNDPVVAIKTLQDALGPAEDDAARAWHELDVPACTRVMG